MAIYRLDDDVPHIEPQAYVARSAEVMGQVRVAAKASIWFGVVVRGDNERVTIGDSSNIQENCVLHTDPGFPLVVGARVTVGHQAMLHGCTVGDGSLIGIQSVVLNGAKIGKESIVGAGSLVTAGKVFPDRALIVGSPAKVVRTLNDQEVAELDALAEQYVARAERFRSALKRVDATGFTVGPTLDDA